MSAAGPLAAGWSPKSCCISVRALGSLQNSWEPLYQQQGPGGQCISSMALESWQGAWEPLLLRQCQGPWQLGKLTGTTLLQ